jgi:uncharacterized repeat protein (TIGR03803 family)
VGGFGGLFEIATSGTFTALTTFAKIGPTQDTLVQGPDGLLWGMGPDNCLYSVTTAGSLTQQTCQPAPEGLATPGPLAIAPDGTFYGTSAADEETAGSVFSATAGVLTGNVLSFDISNGATPLAGLLLAADGTFYGTTSAGGPPAGGAAAGGTLFHIAADGSFQRLAIFNQQTGIRPLAPPVQAADGTLYGSVFQGGPGGGGAIYSFLPGANAVTDIFSFTNISGAGPRGHLVMDAQGNLYGTTVLPRATVYKLAPGGTISYLHIFSGVSPGLTMGSDGNLYGTTTDPTAGTFFQLTPQGVFQTLASFPATGFFLGLPQGELVQGIDGRFYGVTSFTNNETGTVFAASTDGTVQTLASFFTGAPLGALVQTPDGTLYGTTLNGGPVIGTNGAAQILASNLGTLFSISPTGQVQIVAAFDGTNGAAPEGGLILGEDGALYGTTSQGGAYGIGAVFRVAVTAAPPAPTGVSAAAGDGSVALSWSPSPGAQSYNVYQGSAPRGESQTPALSGITGTTATVANLTDGTPYYFEVAAVGATATSVVSSEVAATPAASPSITSFTAGATSVASGGTVTLSWLTQNATGCTLDGGGFSNQSEPASGSATSPPLTAAARFSLTCTGSGGSTTPSIVSVSITSSSGGGGGGTIDLGLLAVLLGAATLRGWRLIVRAVGPTEYRTRKR